MENVSMLLDFFKIPINRLGSKEPKKKFRAGEYISRSFSKLDLAMGKWENILKIIEKFSKHSNLCLNMFWKPFAKENIRHN